MSAASSRAFRLRGDKHSEGINENVPMMLPLIDMCNHSFCPNAKIIQSQGAEKAKMLVKVSSTLSKNSSLYVIFKPVFSLSHLSFSP